MCLFDEYNGLESELLCEKIFVLEKRGEGLIVWRKEFAIYNFLLFCNMSNDQIFHHYYNVWQSHLFALFIDFFNTFVILLSAMMTWFGREHTGNYKGTFSLRLQAHSL